MLISARMGSVANPLNCLPLTARFNGTDAGLPVTENEARGLLVVRKQAYLDILCWDLLCGPSAVNH
jgi:hypothetical protein